MSTEQRDKAADEWERGTPLNLDDNWSCARIGFEEGWDTHAATMPDREALELLVAEYLIETSHRDYGSGYFMTASPGDIADAVLALLNKEGEE